MHDLFVCVCVCVFWVCTLFLRSLYLRQEAAEHQRALQIPWHGLEESVSQCYPSVKECVTIVRRS